MNTLTKQALFVFCSMLLIQGCTILGVGESEYACDKPGKGVCKSARQVYQDISDSEHNVPVPKAQPASQFDQTMTAKEIPTPQRLPAHILRIWIAPWVDKQGHWHSGGIVMSDIYPREWQSATP